MQEYKSFLQLQNRGSVLFIYSDKLHIYVIYHDLENEPDSEVIYKFVLDKQLIIESVHELNVPEQFKDYSSLQWHRPVLQTNGCLVFSGAAKIDGKTYAFKIDDVDTLTLGDTPCLSNEFSLLPMESLKDITVEFHIQKSNKLYAIGYHQQTNEQLFVLIDIAEDKIVRKYTLCSDTGDILANTINIDKADGRVYVGGVIVDSKTKTTIQPFFESFLMSHL